MGLIGKEGEKKKAPTGGKKDNIVLASIGAAKVGKDPVAYTDSLEWGHFAMSNWLDKNFPCDKREFAVLDQKGRPVKVAKPFHILCGHEYKGKRDHSFRQCLNCTNIGTSIREKDSDLLQQRMTTRLATVSVSPWSRLTYDIP